MKVWVIMGNDYPDAVFDSEEGANAFVKAKGEEDARHRDMWAQPKIYWRAYEFELRSVTHRVTSPS